MLKGVSIVLCTYNGKSRMDKTLRHLVDQNISIPCEIIFVDNASNDNTKIYVENWWLTHGNPTIDFQSFEQHIPGKSYAQDLGYAKARYEYLLVCDDDNWLDNNYVQKAFDIMESNNQIGALGGWCEAEFETEKPDWFDLYSKYYAVSKQGKRSGDITLKKGCLYGAGMMIRKSQWLELKSLGFEHILSCRKGNSLSSGGDTEYCYALRLLGSKIWYDEGLFFKHFMTDGRLNLKYLSRLRKAMAHSNFVLWSYLDLLQARPRKRIDLLKYAFRGGVVKLLKKSAALLIGNYEQREEAKRYFRQQRYCLFQYKTYKRNLDFLRTWVP